MSNKKHTSSLRVINIIIVLGIIFFAANLRAPITSVGPVIGEISEYLSLSKTAAGLITTIPLLAFGIMSGLVPKISERYGMELILLLSLIILGIGLGVRSLGVISPLYIGSILIGIAITFGNVLMPAFIKVNFPKSIGSIMGIYTVAMILSAALAGGFSIKIGKWTNIGWQASIGIWIILAIIGAMLWLPQLKNKKSKQDAEQAKSEKLKINLYKSKIAWAITIFMGLQSLLFYCYSAWLPKVTQDWGLPAEAAGWIPSYIQFAQLPVTFIGSIIATRMRNQVLLSGITGISTILGITGFLIFKTQFILTWCILLGIGSGLAFTLCMLFFVLRTQSTLQAAKLSGMAQSIGYLIAATGPPIFGAIFDLYSSWTLSFLFLLFLSIVLLITGLMAGKDRYIS